jgi:hypothetical protein
LKINEIILSCKKSLKKTEKSFAYSKKPTTFATSKRERMSDGVMVTLQILVLPFKVRILVGQLLKP